jgi:hypothetical protein
MTERPIKFNAEMVRAILDGRKTQTRRIMKNPPPDERASGSCWFDDEGGAWVWLKGLFEGHAHGVPLGESRYGQPGDLLWVREPFCAHWGAPPLDAPQSYRIVTGDELPPIEQENGDLYQPVPSDIMTIWYEAEGNKPFHMEWKLPDEMPRWASRITLRITDVRVERLQEITEADAKAEGVSPSWLDEDDNDTVRYRQPPTWRRGFARLWHEINGPGAWDANPWVWVISFERVKP